MLGSIAPKQNQWEVIAEVVVREIVDDNEENSAEIKKYSLGLTVEEVERVRRVANIRRTKIAPTLRWLIGRSLEQWEQMPTEQQKAL